jgi:mannose-6-phosphate isomerase class I
LHETLLPGDACFLDASIPHAFSEMEYNAYERSGAEMLVIRCTTAPVEEREKRAGSLRPAAVSGTRPRHKRNGRAARAAGARRASRDRVI